MSEIYSPIVYRVGDERPPMRFELGEDLTGYGSVSANIVRPDATEVVRSAAFTDQTAGVIDVYFQSGDLNQVGNFKIELVLNAGGSERSTVPVVFYVREALV